MKKLGILLVCLMLLIPINVMASKDEEENDSVAQDLVKVYVFLANDCGYCKAELEYLEGLESYNKKFTIVKKELYDTITTNPAVLGDDYNLGVKVVEALNKAGFKDANTNGTPLVVISDLYASTSYNTTLESIIDEAYENGDKDVVGCIEEGKSECIKDTRHKLSKKAIIILIASTVTLLGIFIVFGYLITKKQNIKED